MNVFELLAMALGKEFCTPSSFNRFGCNDTSKTGIPMAEMTRYHLHTKPGQMWAQFIKSYEFHKCEHERIYNWIYLFDH